MPANLFTINDELKTFLEEGHPTQVGTRNGYHKTAITRSWGVLVQPDRQSVMLFLPRSYNSHALENLRENGVYSIFTINVYDYETYQLKGSGADIQNDISPYLSYMEAFSEAQRRLINWLGLPPKAVDSMFGKSYRDFVPVLCPVEACFRQTPGAGAGERLTP